MKIKNPQKIKQAEIIVGIPSYDQFKTMAFVVEQAGKGLEKYFSGKTCAIINFNHDVCPEVQDAFFSASVNVPLVYVETPKGITGKGYNLRNQFLMMKEMKAKAGATVDSDLKTIRPEWMKRLIEPIYQGYDFVAPYYLRCKTDATITNHLIYPLVYGLLGYDLRQPIGGEFGFSSKMSHAWLEKKWKQTTYQFGIDIFMSLTALFDKRMRVCQANLGSKLHDLSTPKLGPMFFQVTGTLFDALLGDLDQIKKRKEVEKIDVKGGRQLPILANAEPEEELFRKIFLEKYSQNCHIITKALGEKISSKLNYSLKNGTEVNEELWSKIVYDFLAFYKKNGVRKSALIEALGCLFFGRVATFFKEIGGLAPEEAEKRIAKQARHFFKNRNYFVSQIG